MTMLEIYRSRKEQLAARIRESKSLFETGSVISETFETMQYQYLSQADNERLAPHLERIIGLVKTTFPLIESVNKTHLWENAEGPAPKKKNPVPGLIAYIAGLALIFVPVWYVMFLRKVPVADIQNMYIAMAAGCLVMFVAGFMLFHRRKQKNKAVVQVSADAADLVNRLEDTAKLIDKMLADEAAQLKTRQDLIATAINDDEVQLFSYLLEAKASGQADFALEQLDEVEHYLAKQDVIIVNYTKGNERYFDFLIGDEVKTIRPALIRKGRVLSRGLARVKEEIKG